MVFRIDWQKGAGFLSLLGIFGSLFLFLFLSFFYLTPTVDGWWHKQGVHGKQDRTAQSELASKQVDSRQTGRQAGHGIENIRLSYEMRAAREFPIVHPLPPVPVDR
jgi:hypothetical protein